MAAAKAKTVGDVLKVLEPVADKEMTSGSFNLQFEPIHFPELGTLAPFDSNRKQKYKLAVLVECEVEE